MYLFSESLQELNATCLYKMQTVKNRNTTTRVPAKC